MGTKRMLSEVIETVEKETEGAVQERVAIKGSRRQQVLKLSLVG